MTSEHLDRCFAFDQFGPLSIRPPPRQLVGPQHHPDRLPATYRRTHGIRYFHGCYALGDDQLWGTTRRRKGADHTLAALKSIRAARPDGGADLRDLGQPVGQQDPGHPPLGSAPQGRAVFHPDQRLLGQPDRGQFGPLRSFVLGGSDHPNHPVLARKLQAYLRWRNANARHPEVLAAQRRERARVRSERPRCWGRPVRPAA